MAENKWGNRRKRDALRAVVFRDRFDDEGNKIYAGDICYLCGRKIDLLLKAGNPGAPEMEDIIPVSQGGNPLDPDNLRPAHKSCNGRKGDKPVDVALRNELSRRQTSRIW
jgi:5-methylcytosine-specific restriction endonuclease McrA